MPKIQGMYAGEVGVPRLLKLFKKYGIKTTWFIPGEFYNGVLTTQFDNMTVFRP